MVATLQAKNPNWINDVVEQVRTAGYAVVDGVLNDSFIEITREAMYRTQRMISAEVGEDRLQRSGELGVLRLMMRYDSHFFKFLEIPELLMLIDRTVSNTAIMHLQNGFILPSSSSGQTRSIFQNSFHQDFPRVLNGYVASINIMFAIDEFSTASGATLVVPGTHQRMTPPDPQYLADKAIAATCSAGGMVVFDSTLWHAAGTNTSGKDRLAINHQFTRSFIKQQIDYVRALGDAKVVTQKPRTQQLLGWYSRVVTSLDEYYRPEEERLYRKGQG